MRKALFITLDQTLITTISGRVIPLHSQDWKFNLQVVEAIKDYTSRGYKVFIISNQFNIANGLVNRGTFINKMKCIIDTLIKDLKLSSNSIGFNYTTLEAGYKTLPNPGMIYDIALEYGINVVGSILICNKQFDKNIDLFSGIKTCIDVTDLNYKI